MNTITNLTPQQLRQAADIQEKLLSLQNELNQLLDLPSNGYTPAPKGGKRNMSAAGRARLAAFARERWRKVKAMGKSKL